MDAEKKPDSKTEHRSGPGVPARPSVGASRPAWHAPRLRKSSAVSLTQAGAALAGDVAGLGS